MVCPEATRQMALASTSLGDLKTLFDMYHSQMDITDKLWTYFQVITLTIVGFTVGSNKITHSRRDAGIVIGAYVVFCAGNFSALWQAQNTLVSLGGVVTSCAEKLNVAVNIFLLTPKLIACFYWPMVLAVAVGIYMLTRQRLREGKGDYRG